MTLRLPVTTILAVVLSLALAACGSVEDSASADADAAAADADAAAADADAAGSEAAPTDGGDGGGAVTITDAGGEEITLDAPATEVVGLEWGPVEHLVSLGVMPVGVADVEGYTNWVQAAPLDDGVSDVGMRGEPSVDAIVALDPDLVVATTDLASNVVEQIEQAVPVLVVRGASAEAPIQQMRDNLELIAEAVGKTDEAEKLLADFDEAIAEGARRIADAGLEGREFAMADGYQEGSSVSIRMFTDGSLIGAVGEELGLVNAWTGEGDPDYGLAQTDVEGLTVETLVLAPLAAIYLVALAWAGEGAFATGDVGITVLLMAAGPVTAAPLLLFAACVVRVPLSTVGLIGYLTPVLQFLVGWIVFDEPMSAARWAGFTLVWIALAVLTWDGLRRARAGRLRRAEPEAEPAAA